MLKGQWGLTDADDQAEQDRRTEFERVFIPTTRSQLRLLAESYQVTLYKTEIFFPFHSKNVMTYHVF